MANRRPLVGHIKLVCSTGERQVLAQNLFGSDA